MKGQIVLLQSISTRVNFLTSQSRLQMRSQGAPGAPGSQAAAEMLIEPGLCFRACAALCETIEVTVTAESRRGEAEGLMMS